MLEKAAGETMEKKKVVVEIFGETYPLRSDESADYVRQLARFVDENMRDIA